MIKQRLGLEERDSIIVQMLQKNPETSQEEIAKVLKLSQPSVWARIRNLKQRGIIKNLVGMNLKTVDLNLAKIDVSTTNTMLLLEEFTDCNYFVNALITSGKYNVCLFFIGTDLKNLEGIANSHLRNNPLVNAINFNFVVTTAKDFVMPLNLEDNSKNQQKCRHCKQNTS